MKPKLYKSITFEKLNKILPARYHRLIALLPKEESLTVILFVDDEVILSRFVSKALRLIGDEKVEKVIAIGECFTKEALDLFKANNIEVYAINDFYWTDDTYRRIKQPY